MKMRLFAGVSTLIAVLFLITAVASYPQVRCDASDNNCRLRLANADISANPDNALYVLERARIFVQMKDYASALADFDRCLRMGWGQIPTEHGQAMTYKERGDMYFDRGEWDAAIGDYSRLIASGTYSEIYWKRGNAYLSKGDAQSALSDFAVTEKMMREKGEKIGSGFYFQRGLANFASKKWDETISDFTQSISLNPKEPAAFYNRAVAFQNKKDENSALIDLTQAVTVDPTYKDAFFERGRIYLGRESYDLAVADFSKYVALDNTEPAGYANRALAYGGKGDPDSAIADYSSALRIKPGYAFALERRAELYRKKKNYTSAIADYDQLAKTDPSSETPFTARATIYKEMGDLPAVEREYVRFIAANPLHGYHMRGHYYYGLKRYADAAADFSECYNRDKVYGDCLLDRAQTNVTAKNFEMALADIELAVQMKQSLDRANFLRAELYLGKKDYADAILIYEEFIKTNKTAYSPHTRKANALREQGEFSKSEAEYTIAIASGEKAAFTYYSRALLFITLKKKAEAIADLQKALELDPEYTDAKDELKRLEQTVTPGRPTKARL